MQALSAQAIPTDIHYHHASLIWALYLIGAALHVALQIDEIARENKWLRRGVAEEIGVRVMYRTFVSGMVFGLIWYYPMIISTVLKHVGFPVSDDEATVLAIPMNNFIAGLYGAVLDSLLGYIPGLKSWLPAVDIPHPPPPAQDEK